MLVPLVVALAGAPASAGVRLEPEPAATPPPATSDTAQENLASWDEDEPADPGAATSPAPADPGAATSPAPTPIPIVAPTPAVAPPPAVPPDPELQRQRKVASGVAITGATFLGLGGAAWLFLALPAYAAAEVAIDRAQDDPLLVSEAELYDRAERRHRFARISFWAGLGGVVVGGAMLGAGLGIKAKLEREMSTPRPGARLHLLPSLGRDHAGAVLVLRY